MTSDLHFESQSDVLPAQDKGKRGGACFHGGSGGSATATATARGAASSLAPHLLSCPCQLRLCLSPSLWWLRVQQVSGNRACRWNVSGLTRLPKAVRPNDILLFFFLRGKKNFLYLWQSFHFSLFCSEERKMFLPRCRHSSATSRVESSRTG